MANIAAASARRFHEKVEREVRKQCGPNAAPKRELVEYARLEGATVAEIAQEEVNRIKNPEKKRDSL